MPTDQPNGSVSRGRRFGRSLFSKNQPQQVSTPPTRWPIVENEGSENVPPEKSVPPSRVPSPPPAEPPIVPTTKEQDGTKRSLSRRQSKSTLFDLFSKPKVERARGFHEQHGLEPLQERSQTPAQFYPKPDRIVPPPSAPPIRPESRISTSPQKSASQRVPPAKAMRLNENWDPPPLFQAYPQSVRYGRLQTVGISIDTLLRAQQYRRAHGALDSTTNLNTLTETSETSSDASVLKRFSVIQETPDMVEKVYVLVTAGRLVQYSGHGHSDRMPEKILQLGERSAAFACDLIPGKHWVVQVVQSATDEGLPSIKQSRSLLSRLRAPIANRKNVTSFLLVFSSAEDMDSWLKAIRSVIEQLGGKHKSAADPEVRHEKEQQEIAQKRLSQMPSHRYLVQRDPERFRERRDSISPTISTEKGTLTPPKDNKRLSIAPSFTSTQDESPGASPPEREPPPAFVPRRISSMTRSEGMRTNSDLLRLEPLKESTRFSSASIRTSRTSEPEGTTAATSACSSPPVSPLLGPIADIDLTGGISPVKSVSPQDNISPTKRRSVQYVPPTIGGNLPAPMLLGPGGQRVSVSAISENRLKRLSRSYIPETSEPTPVRPTLVDVPRRQSKLLMTPPIPEAESPGPTSSSFPTPPKESPPRRPTSTIGQLPNLANPSLGRIGSVPPPRRPMFRPIPIKTSQSSSEVQRVASNPAPRSRPGSSMVTNVGTTGVQRRFSSAPLPPPTQALPEPPPSTAPSLAFRGGSIKGNGAAPAASSAGIASGRRTPSIASTTATSAGSPSTVATPPSVTRTSTYVQPPTTNTAQPAESAQQIKLRRPTSLQVRTDPAPFLSSRNRPSATSRAAGGRSSSIPPPPSMHKHILSAIALSANGAAMGVAAPASASASPVDPEVLTSSHAIHPESLLFSQTLARQLAASPPPMAPPPRSASRASSRVSHVSRVASPTPTSRALSPSPDLLEAGGPVQPPPPPIPPMNPNRPALRAKNSLSSLIVGLPPPMPPPDCPLPKLPSEILGNGP